MAFGGFAYGEMLCILMWQCVWSVCVCVNRVSLLVRHIFPKPIGHAQTFCILCVVCESDLARACVQSAIAINFTRKCRDTQHTQQHT